MKKIICVVLFLLLAACAPQKKEMTMIQKKVAQFAPTEIKYDHNLLDARQKVVLDKLYKAAKLIDGIFLDQVFDKNRAIKKELEASTADTAEDVLTYFNIMAGPFDRLDHDKPFYGGYTKPAGANFYPADMTKQEFNDWIKKNPGDEAAFTSERTMIRRENGKLVAIPYPQYFKQPMVEIATLLHEAAASADNPSLKKYLNTAADAFLSNDFFKADMAWMDLKDHEIEVIIGPYEVYEDGLFNYKAAFETFITLRDPEASAKLKVFGSYLTDMEKHLPIDDKYKNFNRGSDSPIVVVQEVYAAGDAHAGVQTLAFNLPNDERVREAKGSKKVMLKNIHEAKYEQLLKPIAKLVLDKDLLPYMTFDGFFSHTLMHEMSHGIGPGSLLLNGRKTDVKRELRETYSTIEECKADVLGMYNNFFMIDKGIFPEKFRKEIWVSFLAGVMRSVRFGVKEAHGGGNAIIFNWMHEKGAYVMDDSTKMLRVDYDKAPAALKSLAHKLLMLQATGDYTGTKQFIAKYAVESPLLKEMTARLVSLPVDIRPLFQIDREAMDGNMQ